MNEATTGKKLKAIFFDLDGTVYAGDQEIPGASEFIKRCHAKGIRCMYITNRSNRKPETVCEQLLEYGVPSAPEDVVSTAHAAAYYVGNRSAYIIGEEGLESAMLEKGAIITDKSPDYVVVSLDRNFNYDKLVVACALIGNGSKFIATNLDPRLKLANRLAPGTGAIVAAVETGTGVKPIVLGKPERIIIDMALDRCGCAADEALVIGDFLQTDIASGINAGIETVLMLTGVSTEADIAATGITPTLVAKDFAALSSLLSSRM